MPSKQPDKIKQALVISAEGLHQCYTEEGILAGKHNFVDFWARDGFFASFGSIALGDIPQIKKNLNVFLKRQKTSGHLPYRIISANQFLKYLHIKKRFKKPIANYNSPLGDKVVDQNIIFALVASELSKDKNEQSYVQSILPNLEQSFHWLKHQDWDDDNLIEEGYLANWMDHTRKKGKTLINNVLYCAALEYFTKLNSSLGNHDTAERFKQQQQKTLAAINKLFWHDNYYIDWIDKDKHIYFDTAGNLFAIIYNLTEDDQAKLIMQQIDKYLNGSFIPKANYPYYKKRLIRPQLFLAGLADYAGYRLWIGALYAVACLKMGMNHKSKEILNNMADVIIKHQGVYEIYTAKGEPLRRWPAYKNEVPFAWSCGMYIWAISQIFPQYKNWLH